MKYVSQDQLFRVCGKADRYVRILRVEPGHERLILFDLGDHHALPRACGYDEFLAMVDTGELAPCLETPAIAQVPPTSELSDAARKTRDERMEYIRSLVEDSGMGILYANGRHARLKAASKSAGVGRNQIYKFLRLWWTGGQTPNALAPRFSDRGGRGKTKRAGKAKRGKPVTISNTKRLPGINVTSEAADDLQDGGRYFLRSGRSWPQAYMDTMILSFSDKKLVDGQPKVVVRDEGHRPSFEQFRYWVAKVLKPGEIERAVRGEAAYERNKAERSGSSRKGASGPSAIYQIDATVANIYLRSRNDPSLLVGRPVVYLVTDQYSSMIVGFTVALSPPSWEIAKLAFENAFTDKVRSCADLGIEIREDEWPSRHVCRRVTCDRGSEVMGKNIGSTMLGLRTSIVNLPPYRPDLKGLVEGKFQWLDKANISWAPGATHGRKRGDKDDRPHDLDGHYSIDTFRKFMVASIIRHNATLKVTKPPRQYTGKDHRTPSPNDLWEHGCRHVGAPTLVPREEVRTNLLHTGKGRLADDGFSFEGLKYVAVSEALRSASDRLSGRRWPERIVRSDPRDVTNILVDMGTGPLAPFTLSPGHERFEGLTLEEVKVLRAAELAANKVADRDRFRHEVEFRGKVVNLNRETRSKAEAARGGAARPPSRKRVRLRADSAEKAREVRDERREGAYTKSPATPGPPPAAPERPARPAAPPARDLKPNRNEMLLRQQEAALERARKENDHG